MSETIDRFLWARTLGDAVTNGDEVQLQTVSYDESDASGSFMIIGQLCRNYNPGSFCCRIMNGNEVVSASHFDCAHIVKMELLYRGTIRVVIQ